MNTLQWKLIAKAEFPGTGQTMFSSDQHLGGGVSPQTYHAIDCLFQRCLKFFQMIGYLIVAVVEEMGHSKLSLLNRISP